MLIFAKTDLELRQVVQAVVTSTGRQPKVEPQNGAWAIRDELERQMFGEAIQRLLAEGVPPAACTREVVAQRQRELNLQLFGFADPITTVIKMPGCPAEPLNIEGERFADELRTLVGGNLELLDMAELDADAWINEEGWPIGLEPNINLPDYGLTPGTVIVTGRKNNERASMTFEQCQRAMAYLDQCAVDLDTASLALGDSLLIGLN